MSERPKFFEGMIMEQFLKQARNQLQAANGRRIEWHFAEKEVADHVRERFVKEGFDINVTYTPPLPGSPR